MLVMCRHLRLTLWTACAVALFAWRPGISRAQEKSGGPPADLPPAQLQFFEKQVRPLLVKHCYECHSAGAKKIKGGLLLDSRPGVMRGGDSGPAVVAGEPDK